MNLQNRAELVALDYRSLWLSDIHLGTPSCRAEELLGFIANINAERIYLVGDIIDLQRMKSRPLFPDLHLRVVAEFRVLPPREPKSCTFPATTITNSGDSRGANWPVFP